MIIGIGAICMTAALFAYDIHQKRKKQTKHPKTIRLCITGGPYIFSKSAAVAKPKALTCSTTPSSKLQSLCSLFQRLPLS